MCKLGCYSKVLGWCDVQGGVLLEGVRVVGCASWGDIGRCCGDLIIRLFEYYLVSCCLLKGVKAE